MPTQTPSKRKSPVKTDSRAYIFPTLEGKKGKLTPNQVENVVNRVQPLDSEGRLALLNTQWATRWGKNPCSRAKAGQCACKANTVTKCLTNLLVTAELNNKAHSGVRDISFPIVDLINRPVQVTA